MAIELRKIQNSLEETVFVLFKKKKKKMYTITI